MMRVVVVMYPAPMAMMKSLGAFASSAPRERAKQSDHTLTDAEILECVDAAAPGK
jgi:hypothetical protein